MVEFSVGARVRYRDGANVPPSERKKRGLAVAVYDLPANPGRADILWDSEHRVAEGLEAHLLEVDD